MGQEHWEERKKGRAAEGTDGVRGRRDPGELLLEQRVLGRAQEMNEGEDRADGCANTNHPTKHKVVRRKLVSPHNCRQQ
ncbi:MAG: hypothetical protein DMG36_20180 [Acidobacteria bacterium]|nr:MAG: hypothetical protein DMG36_20180 [Acidobacteriota bacterium]